MNNATDIHNIYVLKHDQYTKIGITVNINNRFNQYKAHNPAVKLYKNYTCSMEQAIDIENSIKDKFKEFTFNNYSEWFIIDADIIDNEVKDFLSRPYVPKFNPDLLSSPFIIKNDNFIYDLIEISSYCEKRKSNIKKLNKLKKIIINFNGEKLGDLLEAPKPDKTIYFEFDENFIKSNISISPLNIINKGLRSNYPSYFNHLPGFIYDYIPGEWGKMLLNKLYNQSMLHSSLTLLDILSHDFSNSIDNMLCFEGNRYIKSNTDWNLNSLSNLINKIKKFFPEDTVSDEELLTLISQGGNFKGLSPKVSLFYNQISGETSQNKIANSEPWVFKFKKIQSNGDFQIAADSIGLEQIYMECAQKVGLPVTPSKYLKLKDGTEILASKRFDIMGRTKLHISSFATISDINSNSLDIADYQYYLKLVKYLTKDDAQVKTAFTQCVFNLIFGNRNDYPNKFLFILEANNRWKIAPPHDLNYSFDDYFHKMNINGKSGNINKLDLIIIAQRNGIDVSEANTIINDVGNVGLEFKRSYLKNNYNVSKEVILSVSKNIDNEINQLKLVQKPSLLLKI